ncbi:hypothetical protein [Bacillus sp. NPDC094106]
MRTTCIMCSECDQCITIYGDLASVEESDLKTSCKKCETAEEDR